MAQPADPAASTLRELLYRGDDAHRPSLENRVAYQWEPGLDTLGYRNGTLRDQRTLNWALDALRVAPRPAAVLDIGCSRGNYLLMLNAMAGLDPDISYVGFDIDDRAIEFGRQFAAEIEGYGNCRFELRSIEDGIPLDDASLDVVTSNDVIEHLPDVVGTLREMRRVIRPTGSIIISTPLEGSAFKRIAALGNRVAGGALYRSYYAGKDSEVGEDGEPIMDVHAGHDHISEMAYQELQDTIAAAGLRVADEQLMPVMSGSRWFDRHPFVLSGLLLVEAVHQKLQRPSWAHGICLRLVPGD